jgi:signal transduction histidine kinase
MSAIASWARRYRPELLWALFTAANLVALLFIHSWETVPFHFIWVSLTLVYGFRVWGVRATALALVLVCTSTALTYGWVVVRGPQGIDELTEIPLMAAMFLAMVWHARRRQAALEEVERAAEREREFVRDASHQLKTPIAVARGMAELIRQSDAQASWEEDMDDLVEELGRLGRIAEGLLTLASAEQQDSLVLARVDFEDVVVGAARRWSRTAQRGWRVDLQADGTLIADRDRLDAALDAIIENAMLATGVSDAIVLTGRADGDDAIIEVSDSGTGIAPGDMARIFDRFSSMRHTNGHGPGTGLGLPIARAIAEAHGGGADARSALGEGTTVTLRLPGLAQVETFV